MNLFNRFRPYHRINQLEKLFIIKQIRWYCNKNSLQNSSVNKKTLIKIKMDHLTGNNFDISDLKNYKIVNNIFFDSSYTMNSCIEPKNIHDVNNFNNLITIPNTIKDSELKRLMTELIQILRNKPYFRNLKFIGLIYKSNYLLRINNISASSDVGMDFNIERYKISKYYHISLLNNFITINGSYKIIFVSMILFFIIVNIVEFIKAIYLML
jgi:hypothetical protein